MELSRALEIRYRTAGNYGETVRLEKYYGKVDTREELIEKLMNDVTKSKIQRNL